MECWDACRIVQTAVQKSASNGSVRKSEHFPHNLEGITCLALVRSGMILSGGLDKVGLTRLSYSTTSNSTLIQTIVLNNMDTGRAVIRWRGHQAGINKVGGENTAKGKSERAN